MSCLLGGCGDLADETLDAAGAGARAVARSAELDVEVVV
jgi:hypothetical protein